MKVDFEADLLLFNPIQIFLQRFLTLGCCEKSILLSCQTLEEGWSYGGSLQR